MKFKWFCMVSLSLILTAALSISCVFASTYEVDPDTDLDLTVPIYYTENYVPGMFRDGISTWAVGSYGSYSAYGWNPMMTIEGSSGTSTLQYPLASTPSVNVGAGSVSASYTFTRNVAFNDAVLFLSGASDGYFDFQSSEFVFDQQAAQADTFYLNGTFSFLFSSWWSVITSGNTSFYTALDPVGVQFLIDGKPYGDVVPVSSYTSPFTGAFTSTSPARATVTFDNLKVYSDTVPELIGFRIYVDSNYSNGNRSLGSGSSLIISQNTTLNWTSQPTITFVKESSSSDADLGALVDYLKNGLFNSNNVPFLDVLVSLFDDAFFNPNTGHSYLRQFISLWVSDFIPTFRNSSGNSPFFRIGQYWLLGPSGTLVQSSFYPDIFELLYYGFRGVHSLLSEQYTGLRYLNAQGGSSTTDTQIAMPYMIRSGLLGLSENIKAFNSDVSTVLDAQYNFWRFDLSSAELVNTKIYGYANTLINYFSNLGENVGRLAYVFANDDEIQLVQSAKPGLDQFKDSFGGGAGAGDILEIADSVGEVQGMFDTGFGVNDLWDSLKGESWWSWFTTENAQALDSTGQPAAVGDEDPFNMQTYYDHLQAVQEIRSRGEDE